MGETKSTDYIPENANEEYALLVGRLKAFEAWANSVNDYDFTKDMAFRTNKNRLSCPGRC